MDIQINLLPHHPKRFNFTVKNLEYLSKIKKEYKSRIKLNIYTDKNISSWKLVSDDLNNKGIKSYLINKGGYLPKIHDAVNTDCKYSCSIDEDVLMSEHSWNSLIENLHVLDDENILLLSPLITNGIPTTELFIESFFSENEKETIFEMFNNTFIPNLWGVDYSKLNNNDKKWNKEVFYDKVKNLNHYYKGIHPIRVSKENQMYIVNEIHKNKDKFLSPQKYKILIKDLPYFCNNVFFIKTDIWKNVIQDKSLFRDSFDEVPLNIYKEKTGKKFAFLDGSYALHMAFNTLGSKDQSEIENFCYQHFL